MKNLLFTFLMLGLLSISLNAQCTHPDYNALVAFYNSSDGPNWVNTWDINDCDPCYWYGVNCNGDDRVIGLDLKNNGLVGNIPSEVGDLSFLLTFEVLNNSLESPLPDELWSLTDMVYFSLLSNDFAEPFPQQITNFTSLQTLRMGNNEFTGSLPSDIGDLSQLSFLAVFANQLSGPIPESLWDLTNLTWLNLNVNNFSGGLSPDIGNLLQLQNLGLFSNELTGELPTELGQLTNLYYAQLQGNQFTGEIPAELSNLVNITAGLFTWNNQLDYCIPEELSTVCGLNFRLLEGDGSAFIAFCEDGSNSCCVDNDEDGVCEEDDNCELPNPDQADSDCDGVGDACDVCDGGDDSIDEDGDGLPDCANFPGMDDLHDDWICKNNKILICHNGVTNCVNPNSVSAHLGHGDYLGPCNYVSCDGEEGMIIQNYNVALSKHDGSTMIHPNPMNEKAKLAYTSLTEGTLVLRTLDVQGKLLQERSVELIAGPNYIDLDFSELESGSYYIQIEQDGIVDMLKFIRLD